MSNQIFIKILEDSIERFVNEFSNLPPELFYDEERNIFHPGEYGKYREETIKKLFRIILYEDLTISDGFLINNNNQHSTQCDIIVYDSYKTPILKDSNKIFIPVETAVGIGEVKSTLSKKEFKTALRKLAQNKKLKEFATGSIVKRSKQNGDFDAKSEHSDQLFSFLICKKLDFDIGKIDFEDIYEGIENRNKHNLILSIEDGLFHYYFTFDKMEEHRKKIYLSQGVNLSKSSPIEYPNFLNTVCDHIHLKVGDKNEHIKEFISELHYGIHNATILDVDIRSYYRSFLSKEKLFV